VGGLSSVCHRPSGCNAQGAHGHDHRPCSTGHRHVAWGNGGQLLAACCRLAPVNQSTRLHCQAPAMLAEPRCAALSFACSYLAAPCCRGWANICVLANDRGTPAGSRQASCALSWVTDVEQHKKAMTARSGPCLDWVTDKRTMSFYRNRAAFDARPYTWALRAGMPASRPI